MSNVQRFGATGDGATDDTMAIRHAIQDGDGMLHFPPGTYRITEPIGITLAETGPLGIDGTSGTARILMTGPGPAFRLIGTHGGTGDPLSVRGNVFPTQRLPTIRNIEIEGAHPEADGIQLLRTMQSVFEGVLIRRCRHGIHLFERNRNVLISHCHVYFNTGVGIFLDHVNLHQINIASSHISYNRLGGIRLEASEVRNLQITGNDIEYNNHAAHKTKPEPTAEIYVDTSEARSSVAEITIASNTIQATESAGGCNICIRDVHNPHTKLKDIDDSAPTPHLCTISGNIIGSQENNVHLVGCQGTTITGNCIYSCAHRNLLIENSHHLNISGNVFRRHTSRYGTGVRIERSHDITISGCTVHDEHPDGQPSAASTLELIDCNRVNISGAQLLDGVPHGLHAHNCSGLNVTGCTIRDTRPKVKSINAVRISGPGKNNLLGMNSIGGSLKDTVVADEASSVRMVENIVD